MTAARAIFQLYTSYWTVDSSGNKTLQPPKCIAFDYSLLAVAFAHAQQSGSGVHPGEQHGNRVVFEQSGSYIEHVESGEVTPLIEQRGLYKLKMWVPKDQSCPF